MRARANQLVRDGLECTANDIVTITELENDLNQNGFSNEECLKIGPSNNLLTFQAIHFLNSSGWKANVRTLAYLLSCKYLRLETRLREHKKALKLSAPSRKKVLDEKIEYELEEKQKVEKSSLKFVRNSVESLIKQDAIVDLGDYYLALGNELETSFGKITIDPYNGLYSSVLQKISDIHHLTLHGSPPNQPILLSRKPTLYKPRVHIASTCHDFRDLRREVAQSLREWGYQPYLNEDSDYPVKVGVSSYQACIDAVKQSDCLVLIIGTRYGGMVEDKGISITELEYRTACEVGIPRINFCLNEVWNLVPVVRKNPGMTYPEYFHEGKEKADKIFKFLDYVRKYEKEKTDNWVHPFRDSVGLKEILQKRLEPVFPTKL